MSKQTSPITRENLVSPYKQYATKTVLVFGASGSIGTAVALRFARKQGFNIGLIARNSAKLNLLADECKKQGADAVLPVVADLTDYAQVERAVAACHSVLGVHSIVICVAGAFQQNYGLSFKKNPYARIDLLAIERNIVHATSPCLREQNGGALVLFPSFLCKMGTVALSSLPGLGDHVIWSNGCLGMAEILYAELRQSRVRITAIVLSLTRSNYGRQLNEALGSFISPGLSKNENEWIQPNDVAREVDFCTDNAQVCGTVTEVLLQPRLMMERNHVFNDVQRVEKMIEELTFPVFRDGKVALVTGCGKGIGRGVAMELCRAGYDLIALTRTATDLDSLQEECEKQFGRRVLKIAIDVTDETKVEDAIRFALEHFGTITVVVNNAGTNRRRVAALSDMKTWRQVVEVDLLAAMNISRLTLPYLIRHAKLSKTCKPTLCFVSTGYAHPKGVNMNGLASYVTSKRATNAFSNVLLQEVRDFGVQVTVFDPSTVATDLGLKPNAAGKGGELIDPELLNSARCCGRCIVHICEASSNVAIQELVLENTYHNYPRVRHTNVKWMEDMTKKGKL